MNRKEWHRRYGKRLEAGGFSYEEAQDSLEAGIGQYDYDESPEDVADEEISLWRSDV